MYKLHAPGGLADDYHRLGAPGGVQDNFRFGGGGQERFRSLASSGFGGGGGLDAMRGACDEVSELVACNREKILDQGGELENLSEQAEFLTNDATRFQKTATNLKKKSRGIGFGGGSARRSNYSESDSDEEYVPQVMDVSTAKVGSSVSRKCVCSISPVILQVSAGLFNTTYAIPRATTIPADNTEHKVSITSPPAHCDHCWPKLTPPPFADSVCAAAAAAGDGGSD